MPHRSSETATTTTKLLDAWKARKGIASDNAAGIALGAKRQTVSTWRNGKAHASPAFAAKMAADLGLDELAVLAAIEADRTYNGDDRRVWQKHGRAVFMSLFLGLTVCLPSARATSLQPVESQAPVIQNRLLREMLRRLILALKQQSQPGLCWA